MHIVHRYLQYAKMNISKDYLCGTISELRNAPNPIHGKMVKKCSAIDIRDALEITGIS